MLHNGGFYSFNDGDINRIEGELHAEIDMNYMNPCDFH